MVLPSTMLSFRCSSLGSHLQVWSGWAGIMKVGFSYSEFYKVMSSFMVLLFKPVSG